MESTDSRRDPAVIPVTAMGDPMDTDEELRRAERVRARLMTSRQGRVSRRLSAVLSEFARTMVTEFPIQAILDRLVQSIVGVLPITAAGVTLISPDARPHYVAASNESALRYEKLQSEVGEGPCLAAYQTGEAVAVADLHEDTRFPRFAPRALEAGLVAVFTFPLRHGDHQLGALDLYRDVAGALDPGAMRSAQTLADVAAAYLLNAQSRTELRDSSERTERLAAIVESSNDSIVGWTATGHISSWNSGAERIYGYAADEAIDRDLSLIVSPEHLAEMLSCTHGCSRARRSPRSRPNTFARIEARSMSR